MSFRMDGGRKTHKVMILRCNRILRRNILMRKQLIKNEEIEIDTKPTVSEVCNRPMRKSILSTFCLTVPCQPSGEARVERHRLRGKVENMKSNTRPKHKN